MGKSLSVRSNQIEDIYLVETKFVYIYHKHTKGHTSTHIYTTTETLYQKTPPPQTFNTILQKAIAIIAKVDFITINP